MARVRKTSLDRRGFLKGAATGAAALTVARWPRDVKDEAEAVAAPYNPTKRRSNARPTTSARRMQEILKQK